MPIFEKCQISADISALAQYWSTTTYDNVFTQKFLISFTINYKENKTLCDLNMKVVNVKHTPITFVLFITKFVYIYIN